MSYGEVEVHGHGRAVGCMRAGCELFVLILDFGFSFVGLSIEPSVRRRLPEDLRVGHAYAVTIACDHDPCSLFAAAAAAARLPTADCRLPTADCRCRPITWWAGCGVLY